MKSISSGVIAIIGALLIGVIGFFVGTHFGSGFEMRWGTAQRLPMMQGGMMRGRGFGGYGKFGAGHMGRAAGQITKITGNTVTLKYPNGVTQDITVSGSTVVDTIVKGTTTDLKVGQNVVVGNGGTLNGTQTILVQPQ